MSEFTQPQDEFITPNPRDTEQKTEEEPMRLQEIKLSNPELITELYNEFQKKGVGGFVYCQESEEIEFLVLLESDGQLKVQMFTPQPKVLLAELTVNLQDPNSVSYKDYAEPPLLTAKPFKLTHMNFTDKAYKAQAVLQRTINAIIKSK